MRVSAYEALQRERIAPSRAARAMERRRSELVRAKTDLAAIALDLALLELERILEGKYRPDQLVLLFRTALLEPASRSSIHDVVMRSISLRREREADMLSKNMLERPTRRCC